MKRNEMTEIREEKVSSLLRKWRCSTTP